MNSVEMCPSCKNILHSHNNQQILECIKKQLEKVNKQEEKTLAVHSSKDPTKNTSQRIGGSMIA